MTDCFWQDKVKALCGNEADINALSAFAAGSNSSSQFGSFISATAFGFLMSDVISVAASNSHAAIVLANGTLLTAGDNTYGELGRTGATNEFLPVPGTYKAVFVANDRTYAIDSADNLYSCGSGALGMLGIGEEVVGTAPPTLYDKSTMQFVAAGVKKLSAGRSVCMYVSTGDGLFVFGSCSSGSAGLGFNSGPVYTPVSVGSGYDDVACGTDFSLALTTTGNVEFTGANNNGAAGDGGYDSFSFRQVSTDCKSIAVGAAHSLIVKNSGVLMTSGGNDEGQVGDGGTFDAGTFQQTGSQYPNPAGSGQVDREDYVKVFAGGNSSFAIRDVSTLEGWGRNSSEQLGISGAVKLSPEAVGDNFVYIDVGFSVGTGNSSCSIATKNINII